MKRIKRFASVILAVIMMFAMTITAFADEQTYTITINGKTTGHKYEAYQVFVGDLQNTGTADQPVYKLSNIRWAEGVDLEKKVDEKTLMEALNETTRFAGAKNATDVAEKLSKDAKAADTQAFADIIGKYLGTSVGTGADQYFAEEAKAGTVYPYTKTVNSPGYYFVRDAVDPNGTGNDATGNASYTDYILQVVGPTTVESKDTTVEIDKDILDPDPVKTNMAGIGDNVTYQLTSKVPNYGAYDYYYFVMQDNLSPGLDFNNDVVVSIGTITTTTVGEGEAAKEVKKFTKERDLTRGTDYYVYSGADDTLLAEGATATDKTFKIAFNDIKTTLGEGGPGKDIVVTYSAKINENAVIGGTGNKNDIRLIYSNNPNNSERGDVTDKPGLPDSTKNVPTGTTPESIVVTFVAEVDIYKTDGDGNPLAGAEFTLTGFSTETVLTGEDVYVPSASGTYYQLKEGGYTTDIPNETATMQPLPAGATAGYVVTTDSTAAGAVEVDGTIYRPYQEGDEGTVYILVEPNSDKYASVTVKFEKTPASSTTTTTKYVRATGTSGTDGKVTFTTSDGKKLGLGDGTYTITETKTPAGYNTIDPITLVISGKVTIVNGKVTGEETCEWSFNGSSNSSIKITDSTQINDKFDNPGDVTTGGIYWTNIVNRSGSLLPSTGGIGTTIFYVVGGILVIGAGILLVAKKRMGKN